MAEGAFLLLLVLFPNVASGGREGERKEGGFNLFMQQPPPTTNIYGGGGGGREDGKENESFPTARGGGGPKGRGKRRRSDFPSFLSSAMASEEREEEEEGRKEGGRRKTTEGEKGKGVINHPSKRLSPLPTPTPKTPVPIFHPPHPSFSLPSSVGQPQNLVPANISGNEGGRGGRGICNRKREGAKREIRLQPLMFRKWQGERG